MSQRGIRKGGDKDTGMRGYCKNCDASVILVERKRIEDFRTVGTEWICPFCGKAVEADNHSSQDRPGGSSTKGNSKGLGALFGEDAQEDHTERKVGLSSLFGGESEQVSGTEDRRSPYLTDASEIHCCRECFHCTFNLYHCHCCYYNKDVDPSGDCPQFKAKDKKTATNLP